MQLKFRLAIKKIPGAHRIGTLLLDKLNTAYYSRTDKGACYTTRLRRLRGMHHGERCFVIGNGPSLRSEDLDLIRNETSFASNLIFKFYDSTSWRPDFYFAQDVYDERLRDYVESLSAEQAFIGAYFLRKHRIRNRNPIAYRGLKSQSDGEFSNDCSTGVYETATVTFTMLQFAVFMGFSEIYLLGIDNTYRNTIDSENNLVVNDEIVDHFYESTTAHVSYANVNEMTRAYVIAREAAAERGVRIFNATRGGALEVFPRVALEDVMDHRV